MLGNQQWASVLLSNVLTVVTAIIVFAADGTKLGITLNQSNIVPVECENNNNVVSTSTKRYDKTWKNGSE